MLSLDRAIDDKWLVASGLSPGDRMIVEGLQNVRPGDSVKAVPLDPGGEQEAAIRRCGPDGRGFERGQMMLSRFFLDRPVFAWVIAIIMMVAGGLAIYNLPISQYPPIAPPSIAITAFYPGASAQTVEDSVVQIIEQKMIGFDKLLYMSATSDASGAGRIELTFAPGTDPDLAWAQVQNKLQLAMASLPEVVQRQGVTVSKSTRNWLLVVGLVSEDGSMDTFDLGDYAQSNLEKVLSRVPGVGEVETFSSPYAMRIWLDPGKLTAYRLTTDDVVRALRSYNVEVSAGQFGGAPAVKGQRLNASIIVQSAAPHAGGVRRHSPARQLRRLHRARAGRGSDGAGHRALRVQHSVRRKARSRPCGPAGRRCKRPVHCRCRQGENCRDVQILSPGDEGHLSV